MCFKNVLSCGKSICFGTNVLIQMKNTLKDNDISKCTNKNINFYKQIIFLGGESGGYCGLNIIHICIRNVFNKINIFLMTVFLFSFPYSCSNVYIPFLNLNILNNLNFSLVPSAFELAKFYCILSSWIIPMHTTIRKILILKWFSVHTKTKEHTTL